MRSRTLSLLVALAFAAGCGGASETTPDAGGIDLPADSGTDAGSLDAGEPDAGEPEVDAGPTDAGFGPFAVARWCELYAVAVCARDERCLLLDPQNSDACRIRETVACAQEEFSAGVSAQRLQYDPQAAADCVNAFAHGSCSRRPDACDAVFTGTVAPEGSCLINDECQSGGYCNIYSNACPFRCNAYQPIGATCNWSDRQCDPAAANCRSVGASSTCVARKGVGETC